jgi:hypothetical protein
MKGEPQMTHQEILREIDCLTEKARQRMSKADPSALSLHPAEMDWMTFEELKRLEELKRALPSFGEQRAAARERIARKRAERRMRKESLK